MKGGAGERRVSRRDALRITAVAGVSLATGGAAVAALLREARLRRVQVSGIRMGTVVRITVVHPDGTAARRMVDDAFTEMERLEAILSRHRRDTAVSRLNREGLLQNPPPELVQVLRNAVTYSERTEGAFDVTVGPLLQLFQSRVRAGAPLPSPREIEEARARVGYRALRVGDEAVRFERAGMSVTLDGIAKGYIVDRTLRTLVEGGADRVLVDGGGDMASAAQERGEPWWVSVQDPRNAAGSLGTVGLRGQGVATSGDYVQTFTENRSLHHILDPRTGSSPGETSSVTAVTPTALAADALSTAAFVLGPQEGLALLEAEPEVEGMIVTKRGERRTTRGFEGIRG